MAAHIFAKVLPQGRRDQCSPPINPVTAQSSQNDSLPLISHADPVFRQGLRLNHRRTCEGSCWWRVTVNGFRRQMFRWDPLENRQETGRHLMNMQRSETMPALRAVFCGLQHSPRKVAAHLLCHNLVGIAKIYLTEMV